MSNKFEEIALLSHAMNLKEMGLSQSSKYPFLKYQLKKIIRLFPLSLENKIAPGNVCGIIFDC
jgi:hypothetical protein